jgi:DNA-binding NarL/FixJ family response regulator
MGHVVRVLIVDDDALVRHALRAFLADDDRVVLVGEASDGADVLELCKALSPDVVLMDVKMPNVNGVEATRRLVRWNPRCRVVALTTFSTERSALDVLRAGACGYLLKHSTPDEIIDAVMAAHAGKQLVSAEVQHRLMRSTIDSVDRPADQPNNLTDRERQVVELIATGLSNAEIAAALCYAEGTVKADIRHINRLWSVHNRLQITLRATELGIVTI